MHRSNFTKNSTFRSNSELFRANLIIPRSKTMPATLNCRKLADHMDAYVNGALDQGDCVMVESHLKSCAACREELKRVKAVQGLLVSTIGPSTLNSEFAK